MYLIAANWVSDLLQTAVDIWNNYIIRAFNILLDDPLTDGQWYMVWNVIRSILNALSGLGIGILTVCFLAGLIKQFSSWQDIRGADQLVPLFIRFIIAFYITSNAAQILPKMIDFGRHLAAFFVKGTVDGTTRLGEGGVDALMITWPEEVITTVEKNLSLWDKIPLLIAAIVAIVAFFVIAISILLTIYGRLFELFMHMAFAPIFLPTLASQGTERIGWAYLRSFFGICLRAAVIGLAFVVFAQIWRAPEGVSGNDAAMVWNAIAERAFYMLLLSVTVKSSDQVIGKMMGG